MKDGRERVGDFDVLAAAGAGTAAPIIPKVKRLSLPFGPTETEEADIRDTRHEHNIREVPILDGGLGCALWDGGLVLARWIYANGVIFHNRSVLDLGCGVGLAGIMASHWASEVILTDYIHDTVDNALFNVTLNSGPERERRLESLTASSKGDEQPENEGKSAPEEGVAQTVEGDVALDTVGGAPYRRNIKERVWARLLDWDNDYVPVADACCSTAEDAKKAAEGQTCTFEFHGPARFVQKWVHCRTCWPSDEGSGCCIPCSERCHEGHELSEVNAPERFICDCRKYLKSDCLARPPMRPIPKCDILVGAELTYNLKSCSTLAKVVDKYLSANGVFFEVLSDDRDGVGVFIEEIEKLGFVTTKHPAPKEYTGNYGTRKWSKQGDETYSFFTWRRAQAVADGTCPFPDMQ